MYIRTQLTFCRPLDATGPSPPASAGLSQELGPTPPSSASLPVSPNFSRTISGSSHEGKAEYQDLRSLFNFMNTYLGPKLKLYDDYVHARRTKVSFENLWMLFDVGDIVYSASKKEGYKSE